MASEEASPRGSRGGLLLVLAATAVSAVSSFVVLLVVAPALGPAGYASFSVYWAALFMLVGVLFGVQQEATRAVSASGPAAPAAAHPSASLIRFAAIVGSGMIVVLASTGLLWAGPLFGVENVDWAAPLAVAVGFYVGVAALNGILAGSGQWSAFAAVPLIDGVLRLILVAAVLWLDADRTALAWAVAVPFPVSLAVVAAARARAVRRRALVAESYRSLSANVGRTIVASSANAVLVNGFPVVLAVLVGGDQAALGAVVLALTLTRAPILVPLTALQSMLIARFSSFPDAARRLMTTVVTALIVLTPLLAVIAGVWGTTVLKAFFGQGFAIPGPLLFGLVLASGCLGLLTVTGAWVLARGRHSAFAAGWVIACAVSVVTVALVPGEVGLRTVIALIVGPIMGAAWHLWTGRQR